MNFQMEISQILIHGRRIRSFTLIELIVVIAMASILSFAGGAFFIPMFNMFFYVPSQSSAEVTANELIKILMDGDAQAKGLSDAAAVTAAAAARVDFSTCDGNAVYYRWDSTAKKIYRSINGGAEGLIPYVYSGNSYVIGKDTETTIFTYYDSSNSEISSPVGTPANIEWIRMDLTVLNGTGKVERQHGRLDISTAVDVKTF